MSPRYPVADLLRFVSARALRDSESVEIHELFGMDDGAWYRSQEKGWLSTIQADAVAVRLSTFPSDIWPSWFDDAALEPVCVCGQPATMQPNRSDALRAYCSKLCAATWSQRRDRWAPVQMARWDAHRESLWWERVNEVTQRVSVMTDTELAIFLGIELRELAVAA